LIKHLPIPLSLKRCDNDSFSDKGIVNRYRISIEGYNKIADTFFGHSSTEAFHMRRVLKQEMPIWRLLNMKSETQKHGNQDMSLLNKLVAMQYADPLLQNRIGLLVYQWMPLLLFDFIYKMARRIKRFLNAR
jgi:abequosyltransferase